MAEKGEQSSFPRLRRADAFAIQLLREECPFNFLDESFLNSLDRRTFFSVHEQGDRLFSIGDADGYSVFLLRGRSSWKVSMAGQPGSAATIPPPTWPWPMCNPDCTGRNLLLMPHFRPAWRPPGSRHCPPPAWKSIRWPWTSSTESGEWIGCDFATCDAHRGARSSVRGMNWWPTILPVAQDTVRSGAAALSYDRLPCVWGGSRLLIIDSL